MARDGTNDRPNLDRGLSRGLLSSMRGSQPKIGGPGGNPCPTCGARPGNPCRPTRGVEAAVTKLKRYHPARRTPRPKDTQ